MPLPITPTQLTVFTSVVALLSNKFPILIITLPPPVLSIKYLRINHNTFIKTEISELCFDLMADSIRSHNIIS